MRNKNTALLKLRTNINTTILKLLIIFKACSYSCLTVLTRTERWCDQIDIHLNVGWQDLIVLFRCQALAKQWHGITKVCPAN